MSDFLTILAAEGGDQGGPDFLIMIGMIFLIFWFLVIRPGSKERKQREAAVKALKKNDKVVTNAGIHGTVVGLEDETVTLRVDDKNNIRIKFSRAAIWQVGDPSDKAKDAKSSDGKKKDKYPSKRDEKDDAKAEAASS